MSNAVLPLYTETTITHYSNVCVTSAAKLCRLQAMRKTVSPSTGIANAVEYWDARFRYFGVW